jgi:hypothetical protein
MNRNFAKSIDGISLEFAPSEFDFGGVHYNATNSEEIYNKIGYLRFERTEAPVKEGFYYTPFYVEGENVLLQKWEEHENPPEEVEDSYELLDIITEGVIE